MTFRSQSPTRCANFRSSRPAIWVAVLACQLACSAVAGWAQKPEQESRQQVRFGTEMAQRGLWNEALFRYQRALELRPEDATIYNNLAVSYEALGLFEEALDHYRQGLRRSPADKALKRNYARFVEFYQRHRPDEDDEEEAEGSSAADDGAQDPSAAAGSDSRAGGW